MTQGGAHLERELLTKLVGQEVLEFAERLGWHATQLRLGVMLIQGPAGEQALVPTEERFADRTERLREAVIALASYQQRPPRDVLLELLRAPADIVKFRVFGTGNLDSGVLPLVSASELFDGCKRALMAAACSTSEPRPFYPRLARKEATALVGECTVSAERGSFVATVVCPLAAANEGTPIDDKPQISFSEPWASPRPFARRAVQTLAEALIALEGITSDSTVEELLRSKPEHKGISANLCESMLAIAGEGDAQLEVEVRLSRQEPSERYLFSSTFTRNHLAMMEALSQRLRPNTERANKLIIGKVESLHGQSPEDQVPPSGDVYVSTSIFERTILLRVPLEQADYQVAVKAHGDARYVIFHADVELKRGRGSFAKNVVGFSLLEGPGS